MSNATTIWTNINFPERAAQLLRDGIGDYQLIDATSTRNAAETLREADIALGQPDAEIVMNSQKLRWAHITSAGYTRYDRDDLKAALKQRGAMLSNSSHVFDEPCAQHVLAMMLADARQLLWSHEMQRTNRDWNAERHRANLYLLHEQSVLLLGYGAIAQRLVQLLAPFDLEITAFRRHPSGDEAVETVGEENLEAALALDSRGLRRALMTPYGVTCTHSVEMSALSSENWCSTSLTTAIRPVSPTSMRVEREP